MHHCLGRRKRGGGGAGATRALQIKSFEWTSPRNLGTFTFVKKMFWMAYYQLCSRNAGTELHLGGWFRVYHLSRPPPPHTHTHSEVCSDALGHAHIIQDLSCPAQNCVIGNGVMHRRWPCHFTAHALSPRLRSRFLTAFGGRHLHFYEVRHAADGLKNISTLCTNLS